MYISANSSRQVNRLKKLVRGTRSKYRMISLSTSAVQRDPQKILAIVFIFLPPGYIFCHNVTHFLSPLTVYRSSIWSLDRRFKNNFDTRISFKARISENICLLSAESVQLSVNFHLAQMRISYFDNEHSDKLSAK